MKKQYGDGKHFGDYYGEKLKGREGRRESCRDYIQSYRKCFFIAEVNIINIVVIIHISFVCNSKSLKHNS